MRNERTDPVEENLKRMLDAEGVPDSIKKKIRADLEAIKEANAPLPPRTDMVEGEDFAYVLPQEAVVTTPTSTAKFLATTEIGKAVAVTLFDPENHVSALVVLGTRTVVLDTMFDIVDEMRKRGAGQKLEGRIIGGDKKKSGDLVDALKRFFAHQAILDLEVDVFTGVRAVAMDSQTGTVYNLVPKEGAGFTQPPDYAQRKARGAVIKHVTFI